MKTRVVLLPKWVRRLCGVVLLALVALLVAHFFGHSVTWYYHGQPVEWLTLWGEDINDTSIRNLRLSMALSENRKVGLVLTSLGSAMLVLSVLYNWTLAVFSPRHARWGTKKFVSILGVFLAADLYVYISFEKSDADVHRGSPMFTLICAYVVAVIGIFFAWLALFYRRHFALFVRLHARNGATRIN